MDVRALFALFVVVLFAGCISGAPSEQVAQAPPGNTLTATASEWKFDLSASAVKSGVGTITIKNAGTIPHEFVLYKQSDAAKVLEEVAGKKVEPSAIIIEIEEEEFPVGATKNIQVTLTPGVYEIGCYVAGHYEAGMKATLNVV